MDPPSRLRDWIDKFDERANRGDGCWEWSGTRLQTEGQDYGLLYVDGKPWRAHRLSYLLHNGDLPDGALICHHCDNPPCVNPAHLYAGTYASNALDREQRLRRRIPRGESSATSVLTAEQVVEIRQLCSSRALMQREIATAFGISRAMVSMIHNRHSWTHI